MTWPAIPPDGVPAPLVTPRFRLEPLHPRHNERDHAAWMSSIDHIHATPGFQPGVWGPDSWPFEMSADRNLTDLEMHWEEFGRGVAYAYSVLDPSTDDVIGCVYVDPDDGPLAAGETRADAMVRSWVRASHAHLDDELHVAVDTWLVDHWPFAGVRWPGRRTVSR